MNFKELQHLFLEEYISITGSIGTQTTSQQKTVYFWLLLWYLCISGQEQSSITLDDWLLDINKHPLVQQVGSEWYTEHL